MDDNDNKPEVDDNKSDNQGWSTEIRSRWKKGYSRGRSYAQQHDIQPTGISKQVISANKLKNPSWDRDSRQWIEGTDSPVNEKESKLNSFIATSETFGRVGAPYMFSRMVSRSKTMPFQKYYIGPPNKSRPYYTRRGGRRTHKHKRKNKHTRRRRVQRRRA